ncbi:hypothetical protein N802_18425 [Knoellia sinensis KCTC 19936]|uniref:Response regulatory domain-containing protein n=1 Tax=Knoellia sinensis KCTC 19936 TaxID=1385520 RepID=A0A0A0J9Q7_9MICO|nr:response regulator transcription factor [Knoellia sinensis]KGN32341.1 hypothetical protein N802_18425 [Knoellia sinensis KCTC 19936]
MHQIREGLWSEAAVRVVIADDHVRHRQLMAMVLALDPRITVIGQASDGAEAVSMVEDLEPDVVLLDARMPGVGGVEACARIGQLAPATRCLMLTMADDPQEIDAALAAGATSYLFKSVESGVIVEAILRAAATGAGPNRSPATATVPSAALS